MSKEKNQKSSIFSKIIEAGEAYLDAQIAKSKSALEKGDESNFHFGKGITKDRYHLVSTQGYYEKPGMIGNEFQKLMAVRSSIVAAIIRTRQNKVAAYSKPVKEGHELGYRIVLKDENSYLENLKSELKSSPEATPKGTSTNDESRSENLTSEIRKAEESEDIEMPGADDEYNENHEDAMLTKKAKALLEEKTAKKRQAICEFIQNCGELKDRPFETERWNFDSFLRAIVWDSLTYDQLAVEFVPKEAERLGDRFNIHHFYPIDASTIRYATPDLKRYGSSNQPMSQYNILYPEAELKKLEEETDAFQLDRERLENNEYKYVQIIRGRIERAFTRDELAFGIRNPITDIYLNGYGLSELEILSGMVTSHLQTEHFNRVFFQQGFSAKGILHIKANLNRSKLEELRRHWNHLVSGNRNSFQTPILSGMDDVKWLPLTQSHSEMEFSLWLNYLIKMICAVYQIDPLEIGYGMKEEGAKGGISGDNTEQKLKSSKDKGFIPLMRFLEAFINKNIIDKLDPNYKLEWVGLISDDPDKTIDREAKEVKYKKSVNEIRKESGLPLIPGADNLILEPTYLQWYMQFHPEGRKLNQERVLQQQSMFGQEQQATQEADEQQSFEKAFKIEYYKV